MDNLSIRKLIALNNDFYRANHESFSKSRATSWPGWDRVCKHLPAQSDAYSILDAACGNMRFERYLLERFPGALFEFTCIDSCAELTEPLPHVSFIRADILERLLEQRPLASEDAAFDAAVCFGFMHHVPTVELREQLLKSLIAMLGENGTLAVSFWQFMTEEKLAERARETTSQALETLDIALDEGDYLIGWNAQQGTFRYCHSFSAGEIDGLVDAVSDRAICIDRFDSDGRNGALNGYAVFRQR